MNGRSHRWRDLRMVLVVLVVLVFVATSAACTINSAIPGARARRHSGRTDRSTTSTTAVAHVPALYISTGITPGSLFGWPHYPALIVEASHISFMSLQWTDDGAVEVTGSGEYDYDACTPDCATGNEESVAVTITASDPMKCTVSVFNPADGSTTNLVARVFSEEQIVFPQVSPPSKPVLAKVCT